MPRTLYGMIRDTEDEIECLKRRLEFSNNIFIKSRLKCLESLLRDYKKEYYIATGKKWGGK